MKKKKNWFKSIKGNFARPKKNVTNATKRSSPNFASNIKQIKAS